MARAGGAVVDSLEQRVLLTVTTPGIPDWIEQGPGPISGGQVAGMSAQGNPVAGAINAIAISPTNPNTVFVATVNGGIWKTTSANLSSPVWDTKTDQYPSLATSAIAFDKVNPNIVYAGLGQFSNGAGAGGFGGGILKSTDLGNTWELLGTTDLNLVDIRSLLTTTIVQPGDKPWLFIAGGGGIQRSKDGGVTWPTLSGNVPGLPAGAVSSMAADPFDPRTLYAAVTGQGIYTTVNGGDTWGAVNFGITAATITNATRIRLSVSPATDPDTLFNPVYAGFVLGTQKTPLVPEIYRSDNGGTSWTKVQNVPQVSPGGQGFNNFVILADRQDPDIFYLSGDRQGSFPYVSNAYRMNAVSGSATQIVLGGANGTAPHADSRDMVFASDGSILESDDGGIYRLKNPGSSSRTWESLNGNLRINELNSIAYDSINNTIMGGSQDTGTHEQVNSGDLSWREIDQADGGVVAVDTATDPTHAIHYSSIQKLGYFIRRTIDGVDNDSNGKIDDLDEGHTIGLNIAGLGNLFTFDNAPQFTQPFILNKVPAARKRMLIGTNFLRESYDQGGTLINQFGGVAVGRVRAMAYGGYFNGLPDPDVAYVFSGGQDVNGF
ncbi:MAG TPA: hypothetical protein VGP94_02755, partial [Tepidisphaeraceae bacterium]|nr:hypothetical protein [Tepidisphaeraceae bacterium]